jgi:hypothetical protein
MPSYDEIVKALLWILTSLGAIVAIGGSSAAVAYALFHWLGKTWLEQHFKKQLEELRHENQKEIEQLRHQINSLFSRISKVHEKEFEVLPIAWKLLNEACGYANRVASAYREDKDLHSVSDADFKEFVEGIVYLSQSQKDSLLKATDRNKSYQEIMIPIELILARKAQIELNNYLAMNSIFMTRDLRHQFRALKDALANTVREQEYGRQYRSPELRQSSSDTLRQLSEMHQNIEAAVQQRLHYDEA